MLIILVLILILSGSDNKSSHDEFKSERRSGLKSWLKSWFNISDESEHKPEYTVNELIAIQDKVNMPFESL